MNLLIQFWWAWIGPVACFLWLAIETEKTGIRCTRCRCWLGTAKQESDRRGEILCRQCHSR